MRAQVVGIVGSYRKGGVIDSVVSALLAACEVRGLRTEKVYLSDQEFAFCTNCRACMERPSTERQPCVHFNDDIETVLDKLRDAERIVIGCPVNVGSSNALTQKFVERCAGLFYWPFGTKGGPRPRITGKPRRAVLVSSSTAPAFMNSLPFGFSALHTLRFFALAVGARVVSTLRVGLITERSFDLSPRLEKRIERVAAKLCAS